MTTAVETGHRRLVGIDLARCLALLAMFVAHVAPSPGPAGVLNLTEFLSAALFATLLGISAELSADRMNFPALFASSVVRAMVLVGLGLWLDSWGAQVDIVLAYLGITSLVVAVLVFLPTWALALLALGVWWFTPWAMTFFESYYNTLAAQGSLLHYPVGWLFEGTSYRAFTMVGWAAAGIVLFRLLRDRGAGLEAAGAVLLSAAAGACWWYAHQIMEFFPYTGNHWEVGFDMLLSLAALCWCLLISRLLTGREGIAGPLISAGRMSLTLYIGQIGILALYSKYAPAYGLPLADDSWWMLTLLIVLALGFAWGWKRFLGGTFLRRGPAETLLAWVSGRG